MRIFIGIESCSIHRFTHQQIRETWLKDCPIPYKFFLAKSVPDLRPDELVLPDTADGQFKLLQKFSREIDYVLSNGYDFLFRCHVDTYVLIPRLLRSGFEQHDYVGFGQGGWPACAPLCYGGSGFWLSRPAMECLQKALHEPVWIDKARKSIEDYAIGEILAAGGFKQATDLRYRDRRPGPGPDNVYITLHEAAAEGFKDPHNLREHRYLMEAHQQAQLIPEGK